MAKKIDSFMYPEQIFLAEEDGGYQFYKEDPMTCEDREAAKIDLGALLVGWVGHCDVGNPIVLKVRAGRMDRCKAFEATAPEKIRRGTLIAHFEDFDGNYVEIMPYGSGDFDFPFLGAVVSKDGTPVGFRQYSVRGHCDDGDDNHRIVMFDTVVHVAVPKEKKAVDEAETAAGEEPAEGAALQGEAAGLEEPADNATPAPAPEKEQKRKRGLRGRAARKQEEESMALFADGDMEDNPLGIEG